MSKYEIVMGLEVHAELSTKTKIFCGCTTAFGGEPNTHVCPGCAGMPGTLPVFNREVLEYAVKLGLVLGCDISRVCRFDRKNYFYPDLPKAYQVSQLHAPICRGGGLEITTDSGSKFIRLHQIHMEEDAGKLLHERGFTKLDYNRGCTPLLEIVSEPDFATSDEVIAYLEKLREILMYLDICDCKMQEGSFRADVNLSVRKPGEALGTRTEMKNINSFKAITRAIEFESKRHIEVLESGGVLVQETRRWDDDCGESFAMRSKANATDYRYFPDPDLLPLTVDEAMLERVRASLPELADEKRERYVSLGLSAKTAALITHTRERALFFDEVLALGANAKIAANMLQHMKEELPANDFAELVKAREAQTAQSQNLDEGTLLEVRKQIEKAVAENAEAVADYRAGKQKAFGFLMGQAVKAIGKSASPDVIKSTLAAVLAEMTKE